MNHEWIFMAAGFAECKRTHNFSWHILYLLINTTVFVMLLHSGPLPSYNWLPFEIYWQPSTIARSVMKKGSTLEASCFIFYLHTNEDINLFCCFRAKLEKYVFRQATERGERVALCNNGENKWVRPRETWNWWHTTWFPFVSQSRKWNDKWLGVEKWDVLIFLIYDLDACYHLLPFWKPVTASEFVCIKRR